MAKNPEPPKRRGAPKTLHADMTERFMVRCTPAEEKHFKACAASLGLSLSAWVRMTLCAASGRSHVLPVVPAVRG